MGHALRSRFEPSPPALLEVVEHLWQMKRSGVGLLERWISQTVDSDTRAGLGAQIGDERRHYRLMGEQAMRLGGRLPVRPQQEALTRLFAEIEALTADLDRLCAFHRGVKLFTVDRCSHLIPVVDESLAETLETLVHEDERHIRWAVTRLERLLTYETMRECNVTMGRVRTVLEAAWEQPWQRLMRGRERRVE